MNPIVDAVAGPFLGFATAIIDRIFPDKEADAANRAQLLIQAQTLDAQIAQAQLAVDQQESQSGNLFVAGWRPFIGWVCGAAFAYHFILQPLIAFVMANAGHPAAIPGFDMDTLTTVLMGMLGLGSLRTVEKVAGVK